MESIQSGRWKRFRVKPVKIIADAFCERDVWFPVPKGYFIQGAAIRQDRVELRAEDGAELVRVYVVTVEAIGGVAAVHDRMPRLLPHNTL